MNLKSAFINTNTVILCYLYNFPACVFHFPPLVTKAWDSGKPRLSSSSFVVVRVIGGNVFKPVVFPLEIVIVMVEDVFPGGIIGRIYASDEDENDKLSFTQQPQSKSLFRINQQDGKIVALSGLEPGR